MLADIDARHPDPSPESHTTLLEAIVQVKVIEDDVDGATCEGTEPSVASNLNMILNTIQVNLEEMVSAAHFAGRETGR